MNKLPKSYQDKADNYNSLNEKQKHSLLDYLYNKKNMSWSMVAKECNTYANKVRRDAKKLGVESRDKSQAQSLALNENRHSHPTKGKGHSEESKIRISEKVAEQWDGMTEKERDKIKREAKVRWNKKSPEEIRDFREAASKGVRLAAKEGSVLEKYIMKGLISAGYKVDFHKEHWVIREKLQIDLFLPEMNVAIEVDGPSHFKNIWGIDVLNKNKKRDNEKNGLLLQRESVIIRIRQDRPLSEKFKRDTLDHVLEILGDIKKKRPSKGNRIITIGDK